MTLDDPERPIRTLAEKMRFTEPTSNQQRFAPKEQDAAIWDCHYFLQQPKQMEQL